MNTLTHDLFPETLLVEVINGRTLADLRVVAERFGKQHRNIVRIVDALFEGGDTRKSSRISSTIRRGDTLNFERISEAETAENAAFVRANYFPVPYRDSRNRWQVTYLLTEEGFAFLVMGFTGLRAAVWKIRFLRAFREMERQLAANLKRGTDALYAIRPRWKPIAEHPDLPRAGLIALTGHKSPGSITACRRRMREVGLFPPQS